MRTFFDSTESQEAKSEVLSISAICPRACHRRSSDVSNSHLPVMLKMLSVLKNILESGSAKAESSESAEDTESNLRLI